jgi:hypothetical protein
MSIGASRQGFARYCLGAVCMLAAMFGVASAAAAEPSPATIPAATPTIADDALRVALVTVAPGAIYWERFGHNAILIEDRERHTTALYNFGYFDFAQKNFFLNFIRGRMWYRLAQTDPADDLDNYRAEGRSVWLQALHLSAAAKRQLAAALAWQALPENAEYRYDYYRNNCSTKVRDALDVASGGQLRAQSLGRGRGETYRSLSLAYARAIPWLAVGIHLGLGQRADRRINLWEEAFLPLRLRDLVSETRLAAADGTVRMLADAPRALLIAPHAEQIPPPPFWLPQAFVLGLSGALLLGFGVSARAPRRVAASAVGGALISAVIGLIGLLLAGLWLLTDHEIAWANTNLWLFSPLSLLLVPTWWRLRRPAARPGVIAIALAVLIVASTLVVIVLDMLKLFPQSQIEWLAGLLPWHLSVLYSLWQRQSRPTSPGGAQK